MEARRAYEESQEPLRRIDAEIAELKEKIARLKIVRHATAARIKREGS